MAKVLVVDDDPDILQLVGARLRMSGHDVITASSAVEALRAVGERGRPDVAVLDVAMPNASGMDLVKMLRARPETRELPVVFLSARVSPEDVARGKAMGAQYLTKPFEGQALTQAIERCLMQGF